MNPDSEMGIHALQKFIETNCPGACVPVDLLKIARNVSVRRYGAVGRGNFRQPYFSNRLCLVVDGECCLDRLYGGYYSDWVCGGQWNRMVQFLSVLIQTVQSNNIELAVFFNGGLEPQRHSEWVKQQLQDRKKVNQVLKHVMSKKTPPPKVWWIPPVCLRTCLRMALRHLNITVVCTMDDHHQEVIAFCRENNFHGLMAEDAEYAVFDPPRYFSSEQLKLTYKGSLETKEFILDEVAKSINLHPNRFCIFAALLGNYLLTEDDLLTFHQKLCPEAKGKASPETLLAAVVNYVRNLTSVEDLDSIGKEIFNADIDKIQKFKQCVQYYLNGTKDGFLRYRPTMQGHREEPGCYPGLLNQNHADASKTDESAEGKTDSETTHLQKNEGQRDEDLPMPCNGAKFASETDETELSSLNAYQEATWPYGHTGTPQIVVEPPKQGKIPQDQTNSLPLKSDTETKTPASATETKENGTAKIQTPVGTINANNLVNGTSLLSSSTSTSSSSSSPNCLSPEVAFSSLQQKPITKTSENSTPQNEQETSRIPKVPPEVMRTACERHQKGLMSPWIYQILTQGEIKYPVSIEDEAPREIPPGAALFRPLRQMVYAILYNLHHQQYLAKQKEKEGKETPEKIPDIYVHEWIWSKENPFQKPEVVLVTSLGWAVPTVQRLWFGTGVDDKKRRMRAFLTCMNSDSPLILNTSYVPQHLLVMCCVLRYIISMPEYPILRKQELDTFLAQAVSPHLMNSQYTQDLQLSMITVRGIELAALFMQGVECGLFANDACGAPIPWLMCCPWLFFDGKLFHHMLLKASTAKSLIDVCDGHIEQVAKVERMRTAILEGLQIEFARPPMMPGRPGIPLGPPFYPHPPSSMPGRGRGGAMGRGMIARGGQLEIAGVVVGSWGANYGQLPRSRNIPLPPQVTSVGGVRWFRGSPIPGVGRGFPPRRYPVPSRIRKPGQTNAQASKKSKPKKVVKPANGRSANETESDSASPVNGKSEKEETIEIQKNESNAFVGQIVPSDGSGESFHNAVEKGQFDDAVESLKIMSPVVNGSSPIPTVNNISSVLKNNLGQGDSSV